jgi:tetratricopeptide (TPR) repeat protein
MAAAGQYRLARRFDKARERAEAAVKTQGNYAPARLQLGMVLDETGDAKGAGREFDAAFAMRPSDQRAAAALGSLYARQQRIAEARKMLEHLDRLHGEGAAVNGSAALIHAGLGDAEAAVRALESAERAHEPSLPHRLADYRLRALRSDARIQAMVRRLGLAVE